MTEEIATHSRTRLYRAVAVALLIVLVDQLTKNYALNNFTIPKQVVGSLYFTLVRNHGAAFGIGHGSGPLIVSGIVIIVVVVLIAKKNSIVYGAPVGTALVLGGATSNLLDRIFRDNGGG